MNIRLCTSPLGNLCPLSFQGQVPASCHDQLAEILRRNEAFLAAHGMPDAAGFLAEPVSDDRTGVIDWYCEGSGTPVRLVDLEGEERAAAEASLSHCAAAVQALLDEKSGGKDGKQGVEHIGMGLLRLAMHHPSPSDIWIVNGRPVLTCWGFAPGIGNAEPEDIMRLGAVVPPPPPPEPEPEAVPSPLPVAAASAPAPAAAPVPPAPPQPRPVAVAAPVVVPAGRGCLGWLLPLFCALLLLWLLLCLLNVLPSPLPGSCMRQDTHLPTDENARRSHLDEEYRAILDSLADRAALCRPAEVPEKVEERTPVIPEFEPPKPEEPKVEEPKPEQSKPEEPKVEEPKPELKPEDSRPEERKPEPVRPSEAMPFFGEAPVVPEEPEAKPARPARPKPPVAAATPETKPEKPKTKPEREKPVPEPKKEPPKPKPRSGDKLEIPKDAPKNNDLSFLEGCWVATNDIPTTMGPPTISEYCFNKHGQGRRIEHLADGQRCNGRVRAQFSGANLVMEGGEATCTRGKKFIPESVRCEGSGSSTYCRGSQRSNGRTTRWNAPFRRK